MFRFRPCTIVIHRFFCIIFFCSGFVRAHKLALRPLRLASHNETLYGQNICRSSVLLLFIFYSFFLKAFSISTKLISVAAAVVGISPSYKLVLINLLKSIKYEFSVVCAVAFGCCFNIESSFTTFFCFCNWCFFSLLLRLLTCFLEFICKICFPSKITLFVSIKQLHWYQSVKEVNGTPYFRLSNIIVFRTIVIYFNKFRVTSMGLVSACFAN